MTPLGNDIVDLTAPGNPGKIGDRRFLDRVFTAEEQGWIARAPLPDAALWALWAAKEAAYKAVSRNHPSICSTPRRYRVYPEKGIAAGTDFHCGGRAITPDGELALRLTLGEDRVHATAGFEEVLDRICMRIEEWDGAGDPSMFIRQCLIREIARRTGCATDLLSVAKDSEGPGAPWVMFRNLPLALEISLSHDGRFAAFVFDPAALPSSSGDFPRPAQDASLRGGLGNLEGFPTADVR